MCAMRVYRRGDLPELFVCICVLICIRDWDRFCGGHCMGNAYYDYVGMIFV